MKLTLTWHGDSSTSQSRFETVGNKIAGAIADELDTCISFISSAWMGSIQQIEFGGRIELSTIKEIADRYVCSGEAVVISYRGQEVFSGDTLILSHHYSLQAQKYAALARELELSAKGKCDAN